MSAQGASSDEHTEPSGEIPATLGSQASADDVDRAPTTLPDPEEPADEAPSAERSPPRASGEIIRDGRTFGKYRLIVELARGGMSDVHLAVTMGPAGFSKLLVIKRMRGGAADDQEMRDMMLDEARLAARLNHKHIVQTNEVGIVDGQYFLSMEYLDGQPFHRIQRRAHDLGQPIPLPFSVWILRDVLSGLHHAHELADFDGKSLGVVHRDVSPHNVFVTYDGQVKVVDFGIAKAEGRLVETQTGIIRGKITYMAPEQAFSGQIDRRADVFSVGVMLWEAIAGQRLWGHLSDPEIVARLMHEIPSVRTVRPDAPPELVDLCDRALRRDPTRRPVSAAEMRDELEAYLVTHDILVSSDAIGGLVADLFREERAELRRLIDRELGILRLEAEGADEAAIQAARGASAHGDSEPRPARRSNNENTAPPRRSAIPKTPGVPMARPIPRAPGIPSSRESGSGRTVKMEQPAFDAEPQGDRRREISAPAAVLPFTPPPPASLAPDTLVSPPQLVSPVRRVLTYGVVALVAAGLAVGVARSGLLDDKPSPAGSVTATGQAPSGAPAPLPPTAQASSTATGATDTQPVADSRYIRIKVTTNPAQARVTLDGAALDASPFEGKFPKDGAFHRITVELTGFFPQTKMVKFDKDQDLQFFLHSNKGPKPNPY